MTDDIIRFVSECPWATAGIFLILYGAATNLPFSKRCRCGRKETR